MLEMLTKADLRVAMERFTTLLRRAVDQMNLRVTEELGKAVRQQYTYIDERLDTRLSKIPAQIKAMIPAPKPGAPGKTPTKQELLDLIEPLIPAPLKGENGNSPELEIIAARAAEITLPQAIEVITKNMPALAPAMRDALELLQEGDRPGPGVIHGLEQYVVDLVKKHAPYVEMGGAAVSIARSGVIKAQTANAINFKGAGAPTTTVDAQGVVQLDFAASAGETVLTATETPDGSVTVFTFSAASAQPTYIYSDNTRLRPTTKKGTVNWTWNNGTKKATLSVAPQDEIYATV